MSDIVKDYYNENAKKEWNRLDNPYSNIEFQTTLHIIDKYFKKQGNVIDIGCGPGKYSLELLKRGNKVTLYDISNEELKIAKENIEKIGLEATDYICGDCSDFTEFADNSFDLVLIMGPMYHIHSEEKRLDILKEVKRILKKDGIALVAYLNGLGIFKSSIHECSFEFSNIEKMKNLLESKAWKQEDFFTEGFTTTPTEVINEIKSTGFEVISYFGAESFGAGIIHDIKRMATEEPNCYANLIELCKETCEMDAYRNSTEHIHFIIK